MAWAPTPPSRPSGPGDRQSPPPAERVPATDPTGSTVPGQEARGRRSRSARVSWIAALVLVVALAVVAGRQWDERSAASDAAAIVSARAHDSDIGRALARDRVSADLPLGYQPGPDLPFPGDSYRLLADTRPGAPSSSPRWRVWIGEGVDPSQLCIVAAITSAQELVTCYPADRLYTGLFTITSPVGDEALAIRLDEGDVTVDGMRVVAGGR
jgi:hypothetical protein